MTHNLAPKSQLQIIFSFVPSRKLSASRKTLYLTEFIVKKRAVYQASARPSTEHTSHMLTFFVEPREGFEKKIFICKLTDSFERWRVMKAPCDEKSGQFFGYKGYVAEKEYSPVSELLQKNAL